MVDSVPVKHLTRPPDFAPDVLCGGGVCDCDPPDHVYPLTYAGVA
jgi:hypothetical protein